MYPAVSLLLHLLSLRVVLAATIPVQPNLSAGRPDGAGFVDNHITANQSSLVYDSPSAYTGPLNAQKSVLCDGANFGTGLNLRSCVDAVQQLNRESTQILSFAPREWTPRAKYILPMRSSSGDGRCVIDVVSAANNSPPYYASVRMVRDAAMEIIQKCVDGRGVNDRGGFVGQVGIRGTLVVIVRKYEPMVGCGKQPIGQNKCRLVLDSLPADRVPHTYGPEATKGIAVHTPSLWTAGTSLCLAKVEIAAGQWVDVATWYDIWAAGEAVNAMCVRRGFEGIAIHLGQRRALAISLLKETPRPS
ncbi:MAG: hypothetical protein LQ344_001477 [Seirophora lacunosa]|nr:MAG: hypothetical protein LQ344_001477 [Seirophora lacunosa]